MSDEPPSIPNPTSIPPEAVGGLMRLPHDLRALRTDISTVREGQRANSKRLEHLDASVRTLNASVLSYVASAAQNDVEGATERGRNATRIARVEAMMSLPDIEQDPKSARMAAAKKAAPWAGLATVIAAIIAAIVERFVAG